MRDKRDINEASKRAWELFEKTGSVGFYMLYHELMRKK
jgi:hypothetical protein